MSEAPVLLVTGGSRGIGASVCRMAGAAGWQVAVNYVSNIAAAEAVSELGDSVLPTMVSLVDHSLLTAVQSGGVSRFRMLRTVREYAAARLAESDASPDVHARHATWRLLDSA